MVSTRLVPIIRQQPARPCSRITSRPAAYRCIAGQSRPYPPCTIRNFSATTSRCQQQQHRKESFRARLGTALGQTRVQWYAIPVGLGVAFLGGVQAYKVAAREREKQQKQYDDEWTKRDGESDEPEQAGKPKKRPRVRPSGPWTVQVMSTLPLKALSRWWGWFNELTIPYYLRVPGFKLYGWVFGVNFSEVEEKDLHTYPNLASFFYRRLIPGARPLDPNVNALLSPADGKIVQFGRIDQGEVEQVKGVTYSLDALLGAQKPETASEYEYSIPFTAPGTRDREGSVVPPNKEAQMKVMRGKLGEEEQIAAEEEFANINGISYTLPNLFSNPMNAQAGKKGAIQSSTDQSTPSKSSSEAEVRADLALSEDNRSWWEPRSEKTPTSLYYCVVYLAPGDYHRFHSPVSWVVEKRRHFAGELFSVSPYLVRTLPGLFTLNERVVLLGRWRWGFFSYTPVGATNVGSIIINFDKELRTNSLTTDTEADRAAEKAAKMGETYSGFAEATYEGASKLLQGHALKRGEEMGGFQLGSTIVMVFEAPKSRRRSSLDEGWAGSEKSLEGGWKWNIEKGQKVYVGQALGEVIEDI